MAKKAAAIVAVGVLVFSPALLFIDVDRFSPVVLTIWLLSAAYFVFVKQKKD